MTYKVWTQESNPNVAGADQWWLTPSSWQYRQGTAIVGVWDDVTNEFGVTDSAPEIQIEESLLVSGHSVSPSFYPFILSSGDSVTVSELVTVDSGYLWHLLRFKSQASVIDIVDPIDPPVEPPTGWPMLPLQQYKGQRQVQDELRWIAIHQYSQFLLSKAQEIEVYGAPHLGSLSLIQRFLTSDGLAMLNDGDLSKVRMLFKAWRHLNPERGLHFVKLYLSILFGNDNHSVDQMWQKKGKPYPNYLLSKAEIAEVGDSESDYYLTSRVRVNLPVAYAVPSRVVGALRSAVAARLVMQVATTANGINTMSAGSAIQVAKRFKATNIIHFTAVSRATDSL